jgi:hypothetical protein
MAIPSRHHQRSQRALPPRRLVGAVTQQYFNTTRAASLRRMHQRRLRSIITFLKIRAVFQQELDKIWLIRPACDDQRRLSAAVLAININVPFQQTKRALPGPCTNRENQRWNLIPGLNAAVSADFHAERLVFRIRASKQQQAAPLPVIFLSRAVKRRQAIPVELGNVNYSILRQPRASRLGISPPPASGNDCVNKRPILRLPAWALKTLKCALPSPSGNHHVMHQECTHAGGSPGTYRNKIQR